MNGQHGKGGSGLSTKRVALVVVTTAFALSVGLFGLAGLGALALWKASANCPPADFPRFSDSVQTSFSLSVGSVTECDAEFRAAADIATVTRYMRAQLDSGDWRLVGADDAEGVLNFERRSRPSTSGQVQLLGQGDHSLVQIQIVG
jgi:hypothetical protein